MKSTLQKISITDSEQTVQNILSVYNDQKFCIVNFLYFAQIVSQHVFLTPKEKTEKEKEYKKIILKSDFLLPDGIALQIFYYLANFFNVIKS